MAAALNKRDKDHIKSRVTTTFNEMKQDLIDTTWREVGADDTARRIISMNCRYHGIDEKAMKALPGVLLADAKGIRVNIGNRETLSTVLKRPVRVPIPLVMANLKASGQRSDNSIYQMLSPGGMITELPLLLPDPAGEMIGPACEKLRDCARQQQVYADSSMRFNTQLRKALDNTKSLVLLCAVFPVIRHFITPQQEVSLPMDLTKARGDAHKVVRGVDMGQMIELSMRIEAYMGRRVNRKDD